MHNIIAIIQARTNSKRLPNKVLLDLGGKTVLGHVIERVRRSKYVNEVIVATTISKDDLRICNICSSEGIRVYCGSEDDVLDRYFQIGRLLGPGHIVRITADCPLIDPKIIDEVIKLHLKERSDYTSNVLKATFPDGEDVEVFTFETLKRAWKEARRASEREHVTPYIIGHPELFKLINLECRVNLSEKRWTLDEKKDYAFIKKVYQNLYKKNRLFGMDELLELINRHPEYELINRHIKRNEGYLKSLREDG